MEMNFQDSISNTEAETDIVKNSIIWQCLYALKTVSEFQNLTYRVTKTWNDMEMVAVYRKGVLGIFGPPVDPITLMLDQKGKCLLSIPFKPVQRVSIVSSEYGHVEISSLLAILRMIAGNGYLFCPGLPERFLIGKACAKFVVLHKVPFKRYQSPLCPVYYQAQVSQQKSAKSSLCALCPRCMQAAKWIQSLPVCNPNGTGKAAQLSHPQADQKNVVLGASITQEMKDYAAVPSARLNHTPSFNNSPTISCSVGTQYMNSPLGKNTLGEEVSKLDVNGNSQTVDALKDSRCASGKTVQAEDIKPSVSNKILETKSFLRSLLQKTSTKKMDNTSDHCAETKDLKNSKKDTSMPVRNNKLKKINRRHKNVCRHCKKELSTPANLMNHFQRHEALSGSWCKQFKERKLLRSSSFYPKVVSRLGSKLSFLQGKKPAHLSETTIRLFLKYLNDLILSHKEAKCLAQREYTAVGHEGMNNEVEKHTELKLERPHSLLYEQTEHKALEKRYRRKRTESGLSPMQTLLKAAVIADVDSDVTSPTISSSSSLALGKHHEIAVVSSTTQSPTNQQKESIIPQKKARKSKRLETKKRKGSRRKSGLIREETQEMRSVAASDSHTPLTNLDLLSSVSIKTAMRETQASTQSSITVSHSIPTSLSSDIRTKAANHSPTSDCVSNYQKFLDTSHNSFMVTGSQRKEPFTNMNVSSCSDLSTLPHLLHGANSAYPFLTLKQQAQLQSVSPTSSSSSSSIMATGGNNQAMSESSVMASKMDESPSNGCGAMDLSKPKTPHMFANFQSMAESRQHLSALPVPANIQSMAESRQHLSALPVPANIQSMAESRHNLSSLPNLPHNIAQLVTSSSPAVLQYLMMNKNVDLNSTDYKELYPVDPHSSNKQQQQQADHGLHPGLLAGVPNYKIDRGGKNVAQVQSIVASTSGSTKPGKVKPGASLAGQGDEIQCGYKWTGSGGLVKERTQVVRELVPSHIMANFLSKPWAPATATQPISINLSNNSLPPILSPQSYPSSKYTHPAQTKHQNMPTPQHALNLTMSKSPEFLTRGDSAPPPKSSQLVLTSTSSPAYQSTAVSSVSTGISMLQPSTSYSSGTVRKHAPNIPAPTDIRAHSTTSSLKKKRLRTAHLPPESTCQPSSSLPTAMTTFSSSTISSPSLAAMLLQPALQEHAIVHNDTPEHTHHTVTAPKMWNNRNNTGDSYVSFSPASSYVKTEPVDSHHTSEQDVTLMILPIKSERWNQDTIDSSARANDDRSPPKLLMAMSPESLTKKDKGKALNFGTRPISRAADFVS